LGAVRSIGGNMKVGDLVMSKNRYVGQIFIIVGHADKFSPSTHEPVIQCIRLEDGFKTRWSKVSTWEAI
jgi:hypothetical protein